MKKKTSKLRTWGVHHQSKCRSCREKWCVNVEHMLQTSQAPNHDEMTPKSWWTSFPYFMGPWVLFEIFNHMLQVVSSVTLCPHLFWHAFSVQNNLFECRKSWKVGQHGISWLGCQTKNEAVPKQKKEKRFRDFVLHYANTVKFFTALLLSLAKLNW